MYNDVSLTFDLYLVSLLSFKYTEQHFCYINKKKYIFPPFDNIKSRLLTQNIVSHSRTKFTSLQTKKRKK